MNKQERQEILANAKMTLTVILRMLERIGYGGIERDNDKMTITVPFSGYKLVIKIVLEK